MVACPFCRPALVHTGVPTSVPKLTRLVRGVAPSVLKAMECGRLGRKRTVRSVWPRSGDCEEPRRFACTEHVRSGTVAVGVNVAVEVAEWAGVVEPVTVGVPV